MEHRLFCIGKSAQYGWTRAILNYHIDAQLYERSKLEPPTNNFKETLSADLLEMANEAIKSNRRSKTGDFEQLESYISSIFNER